MDDSDFSDNQEEGEEGQDEVLDPDNPEHAFAIIERDYSKTVTEIEQIPEAAQFAEEFNKLFEAYFHTYTRQREAEETNAEYETELQKRRSQLDIALKLAQEDKTTIDTLKDEIDKAWKLADAAHAREQLAQEIIDNLRAQVENLNAEIEFKNKMNQDSEEVGELSKHKDGLERERDKLINEVTQLATKLNNAVSYQEELERKNSEADLKINEIAGQLEDQASEILRVKRAKDKLEADIVEMSSALEEKENSIRNSSQVIADYVKKATRMENDLKEQKLSYEKLWKENDQVSIKLAKLQEDFNSTTFELEKLKKSYQERLIDIKSNEDENLRLRNEIAKLSKLKDAAEKKIITMNTEKDEITLEKTNIRQRVALLEREIDDYKRFADDDKRAMETINKEKDILNKTIQRQQVVARDQLKLIQIQDQSKKKLEVELDSFFLESGKQKKQIHQLERERDKLAEEQLDLTKTIEDCMDDIRQKKGHIFDLKKTITEHENQVRQQQNIYEAIRADRNSLQKSLQESTAECGELKKKLKIVFHQTEQLKEDVAMKEKLLIKDENVMRKISKEKDNLKIEVMAGLKQIRELKQEIKEQKEEEKRLHKTILEHERIIRGQSKDMEQMMNERDVLGSQLVRRNDEIALLNEKIKILQFTLSRGETQYDQRLTDVKFLKIEVKRLRQDKMLMTKTVDNMVDLKQEIFHLERDLTKSKLQCKALEQEVQNPLNIHRWRKLEGSDPEVVELLQKIKILQKRLLHQASEGVERERQLKEAERLYLNLRQVLAKQPGPGILDELTKTQRALKLRGDKLKCLVSELNLAELKVTEYKQDLQKVNEELAELKRKYLEEKKANQSRRATLDSSAGRGGRAGSLNEENSEVRFTGGGFRMSVQQIASK
ncbi:cilia- and flagella-associated protein 58-like [Anthonomus grandis grandis]|uniref:cilia- and flagella-associated protein 58-like n=1 Tax=Anthonomus grandis grandis TaxID=2921223 RepID=UPI002166151A|nr:cilia- and flagella-associated protein 58-like [Anthonomus grandis grandis]